MNRKNNISKNMSDKKHEFAFFNEPLGNWIKTVF